MDVFVDENLIICTTLKTVHLMTYINKHSANANKLKVRTVSHTMYLLRKNPTCFYPCICMQPNDFWAVQNSVDVLLRTHRCVSTTKSVCSNEIANSTACLSTFKQYNLLTPS